MTGEGMMALLLSSRPCQNPETSAKPSRWPAASYVSIKTGDAMKERHCDNCVYAAIYNDGETLGCLVHGKLVGTGYSCEDHRFRLSTKRGEKKKIEKQR